MPEPLTPESLAAIEARANAATAGPWSAEDVPSGYMVEGHTRLSGPSSHTVRWRNGCGSVGGEFESIVPDDAAFIAHARTDIPALVAYARELERERDIAVDAFHRCRRERDEANAERDELALELRAAVGHQDAMIEGFTFDADRGAAVLDTDPDVIVFASGNAWEWSGRGRMSHPVVYDGPRKAMRAALAAVGGGLDPIEQGAHLGERGTE